MTALLAFAARYKIALVLGVAVLLAIVTFRIVGGLTEYRINVPLDSADGLYPGSDVLVAGAKAGTVDDVKLDGGLALVTLTLDDAHAPVHSNARVRVRPKSLLGEKYIALDPGTGDTLPSGSTLPRTQTAQAVDLQDVVNTLDQPTREKLRTLVIELGGGLSGRGQDTNQTFQYGRQDLDDLAAVANTLAARDQQLQQVIQGLDQVTAELARSDRSQQLGGLIQNSQTLLGSLSTQDAQIRTLLVEANAALSRSDRALSGSAPALNDILVQSPQLMGLANELTADLGAVFDATFSTDPSLQRFDESYRATTDVFGAVSDANGQYATRITIQAEPGAKFPTSATPGTPDTFNAVIGLLLSGGR
jgi:phospholipid/cholesterol/gamma-HCH transport system substrate-binding protein